MKRFLRPVLRTATQAIFSLSAASMIFGRTAIASTHMGGLTRPDAAPAEIVIHRFSGGSDGKGPDAGLGGDSSGSLYGVTLYAGTAGQGTAFKVTYSAGSYSESPIHQFGIGSDGAAAATAPIIDASGSVFGVTYAGGKNMCTLPSGESEGCGIVYRLTPSGGKYVETILHNFEGGSDGYAPDASLTFGKNGVIYGTTQGGGLSGAPDGLSYGTVFELTPSGSTYRYETIYRFQGAAAGDGEVPESPVIVDPKDGSLFGTTFWGGANSCSYFGLSVGCGTVFHLVSAKGATADHILYDFTGSTTDGDFPASGVIADAAGNLYGPSSSGVFELVKGPTYQFIEIHPFAKNQNAGALLLNKGNLVYISGDSVVELSSNNGAYSQRTLYKFDIKSDGQIPNSPLIANTSGDLFGTTYTGGLTNCGSTGVQVCGTVFEISP